MSELHNRSIPWIATGLAILMLATRFNHQGSPIALPDGSLAVFFLAGWYFRSSLVLAGFLAGAFAIDYWAIAYGGVSSYCISPAYGFLVPAYASLWAAGRWTARGHAPEMRLSLLRFAVALWISTTAAYLISEISFFLFSGRETSVGWMTYLGGMIEHYPGYLTGPFVYCGLAIFLQWLLGSYGFTAASPLRPR